MGFIGIILPIFGIFVLGFVGQKKFHIDIRGISTISMYLMTPFLVFRTFYETTFHINYIYLVLYCVLLCLCLILVDYLIAAIKKYSLEETCGMILSTVFMNSGNYGVPVVMLLFGVAGLDSAIIIMVVQQIMMYTVGVYYAAKGSKNQKENGVQSSLIAVIKMPVVYSVITGIIFNVLEIPLSDSIMAAINLVADASVPTIMISLGMQLANISMKQIEKQKLSLALLLKLVVSPIIAFGITLILPIDAMGEHILIILAAMPAAANTTMLAIQYNTKPDFVSSVTLLSTLLSLITLPIVFWIIL